MYIHITTQPAMSSSSSSRAPRFIWESARESELKTYSNSTYLSCSERSATSYGSCKYGQHKSWMVYCHIGSVWWNFSTCYRYQWVRSLDADVIIRPSTRISYDARSRTPILPVPAFYGTAVGNQGISSRTRSRTRSRTPVEFKSNTG